MYVYILYPYIYNESHQEVYSIRLSYSLRWDHHLSPLWRYTFTLKLVGNLWDDTLRTYNYHAFPYDFTQLFNIHLCCSLSLIIIPVVFSSIQFSRSVMSNSLQPHESQHARLPCPSPTPRIYSNSCPLGRWCHPAISSSVIPFSSCPQSLPESGSFPMSQLFAWGGQSIGVSASVLPMNTQDWSPLGWTGWISLQGLSRVFSNTIFQKHQFFGAQLSSQSNSHIHTWPLEKPQPWLVGPLVWGLSNV